MFHDLCCSDNMSDSACGSVVTRNSLYQWFP